VGGSKKYGLVEKRMDGLSDAGIPGRHPKNRPPLSEGDKIHPTKNKSSERAEITGKLGEKLNGFGMN
jgi:hypothetical protein